MQVIELASGRVEQLDDGLFVFRPKAAFELTAEDLRQYLTEAHRLAGGLAYAMVDRRSGYSLSFQAQEVLRMGLDRYLAAIAYVANPGLGFSVASFTAEQIVRVPAQVFVSEEDALAWLRSQRD